MTGTKPLTASLSVWSSLGTIAVSVLAMIGTYLGYNVDEAALTAVADQGAEIFSKTTLLIGEMTAFVTGVGSLWGRIRATKKIG